jgi:DNA polymerase III gamma/tau subunit
MFKSVETLTASGKDLRQALYDLLEYLREILLVILSPSKGAALPDWAENISAGRLLSLIQSLGDADSRLRYSLQPRITLELALLAAMNVEQITNYKSQSTKGSLPSNPQPPMSEIVGGANGRPPETKSVKTVHVGRGDPGAPPAAQPVAVGAIHESPVIIDSQPDEPSPEVKSTDVGRNDPVLPPVETGDEELTAISMMWPQILQEVKKSNISTYAFIHEAVPDSFAKGILTLAFLPDNEVHMHTICSKAAHKKLTEETIKSVTGIKVAIKGCLKEMANPPQAKEPDLPPDIEEQQSLFGD